MYSPSFVGRAGFTAPLTWKLFYIHVPIALVAFVAYGVALIHSVGYLVRPDPKRDQGAHAAIECGVVLSALTLATGMVWGEAEWGRPWNWGDAKLVLVLVMFLIYVAYLLLRREIEDPERRARIAAAYAVAGFVTVPLTWFAHRIWATSHPQVFAATGDGGLETPGVFPVFLAGLGLFTLVFLALYRWRTKILRIKARLDEIQNARELVA